MCPLGSTVCWMPFFSSAPTLGMSLYVRAAGVFFLHKYLVKEAGRNCRRSQMRKACLCYAIEPRNWS